ncbi:M48 family metallopeptidase [Roseitranquillus sediminis]|uniref:M48 family metallopeptidase n=1 Tax=Roseitranquillus sediminis TaxID=2809051 RepID=UPI001D0C50EC|nr:M48 family metallopeptidase [Roseitranquillus sediminis]MBM9594965.1 M48 family metallopeptidase [Roseitranquillus sediminis]
MHKIVLTLTLAMAVAGCEVATTPSAPLPAPTGNVPPRLDSNTAVQNFVTVVRDVEPVAEQVCRQQTQGVNCDYRIVVDDRAGLPPNAFQTRDESGQPVIGFTLSLIRDARNRDELAFILGHEAAHHIEGHIDRGQQAAVTGAVLAGALASLGGADETVVRSVQDIGAQVGQRRFAKNFELEADALGTRIAIRAGYDPVRGAEYFMRIPDPGNRFLGSHPPNADRIDTVRRAAGR